MRALQRLPTVMLLIFPSIEISNKCCVEVVRNVEGTHHVYSIDPVEMAVLWRGENAKTLHVVDLDGLAEGRVVNADLLKRMVDAVDTPVQVGGGLRTFEAVEHVLSLGVYRVVMGTAAVEDPGLIERVIGTFGTRKVAVAIEARSGEVVIEGGKTRTNIAPRALVDQMASMGVCRVVYTERTDDGAMVLPFDTLRELAGTSGLRVTCGGGVESYRDLVGLQELEASGVDSVIVGRPLYENRFPCQTLWRLNEDLLTEFGPTRRP